MFSSFGPAYSYDTTTLWGVEGSNTVSGYRGQAEWFVPNVSGTLYNVILATYRQAGSGLANFFIAQDNGSGPGTILESFLNYATNPNGLLSISSVSRPLLQAGVKYWFCDEPGDNTTQNAWYYNNQNYAPGFAFERSQWSWSVVTSHAPPSGVFQVTVSPVPEPSLLAMVGLAGLPLLRLKHFKARSAGRPSSSQMKPRRSRPMLMLWLITVIPLLALEFSASATTALVFNSFGPGTAYNSGADWIVGGSATPHGYQGHAEYFVPGFSGYLNQIQVGIKVLGGAAYSNFFIAQDNGSGIPGAVVESYPNVVDPNGVLTINSVTAPLLQAGQKYWLCDEPEYPSTYTGWCLNSQGVANAFAAENAQSSWYALGSPSVGNSVFSISVVPLPEPSTVGLLLLGAGLLGAKSRRPSPQRFKA